jgi:hypothetical protein
MIIGIFGQKEMGKSTLAKLIQKRLNEQYKWAFLHAFADPVKDQVCNLFGIPRDKIDLIKNETLPGCSTTIREMMQWIGQGARERMPGIWINKLVERIRSHHPRTISIVQDGRYLDEAEAIKKLNGVNIIIWRPSKVNWEEHQSESQIRRVVQVPQVDHNSEHFLKWKENRKLFDSIKLNDDTELSLFQAADSIVQMVTNDLQVSDGSKRTENKI